MTRSTRKSRRLGVLCTLVLHAAVAAVLLGGFALRGESLPLPPPVETVRISLAEPAAAKEEAPPAPPEQPKTPEAPPPPPEQPIAVPQKTVQSPPPKPQKPREKTPKPAPKKAVEQKPQTETAPQPPQPSVEQVREAQARAAAAAEARATALSTLLARIEKNKTYPNAARRMNLEGLVTAEVRLDAAGNIVFVRIAASDADAILDKSALETLQRVQRGWDPIPAAGAQIFRIPIRYKLKG